MGLRKWKWILGFVGGIYVCLLGSSRRDPSVAVNEEESMADAQRKLKEFSDVDYLKDNVEFEQNQVEGNTFKREKVGRKVNDVYYVKIHKTGSTTMQNMLFRYGLSHNLTFAMFDCPNAMSYPHPPRKEYLKHHSPGTTFNLLTHHTQFDPYAAQEYMSRDLIFMTMIRHPLRQFQSTVNYFSLLGSNEFSTGDSFRRFLSTDSKTRVPSFGCRPIEQISLTQNPMAHHLGFKPQSNSNMTDIKAFIQYLDGAMDNVFILEQLDESLLLLKRSFQWELQDILHLTLFSSKFFKRPPVVLPPNAEEIHREHSPADYALYEHFTQKLSEEIRQQGASFQEELQDFKTTQTELQTFCRGCCSVFARVTQKSPGFAKYTIMKQAHTLSGTRWHKDIHVTCLTCLDMLVGTSLYLDAIAVQQWPQECSKLSGYCSKYNLIGRFPFSMLRRSAYFNVEQCQSAMG